MYCPQFHVRHTCAAPVEKLRPPSSLPSSPSTSTSSSSPSSSSSEEEEEKEEEEEEEQDLVSEHEDGAADECFDCRTRKEDVLRFEGVFRCNECFEKFLEQKYDGEEEEEEEEHDGEEASGEEGEAFSAGSESDKEV